MYMTIKDDGHTSIYVNNVLFSCRFMFIHGPNTDHINTSHSFVRCTPGSGQCADHY
ncbi:hypothetical protein HanRHA438_Chr15g0710881 [Helianthus annuus]|nr:hypothetical protein HanRHA438_Chr15g0710881 [Helianthus annuus]